MALLPIVTVPDKRLKVKSTPVTVVDDALRQLMDDMLETMYAAPGIGLSAIQVDVPKRLVVVDVAKDGPDNGSISGSNHGPNNGPTNGPNNGTNGSDKTSERDPIFMVNPEIIAQSDELINYDEGCLSLPEQYAEVLRPEHIKVRYLDYHGAKQVTEASGLLSRCIQHELDHLEGILFVDHISTLKRNMIIRRLSKLKRQKAAD
jgi:peptide deformylase